MKIYSNFSMILTVILSIMLISGCIGNSNQKKGEVNVRTGFNALSIEFLKNTPPQKVFEESTFPVILKIKNNGAHSLNNEEKAIVSLGLEKDYTKKVQLLAGGRAQQVNDFVNVAGLNLEGKSTINPIGEEQVVSYNIETGRIDPQSEVHPSTVIATLCYPYKTILDTAACIDTDVANINPGKKVCSVQDLIFNNGQGAPLAVAKIEVSMLPSQISQQNTQPRIIPQFLIFVENKGQGTVIKKGFVKDFCTKSGTSHTNLNIVYVDVTLSGKKLECQLEKKQGSDELGHIKLKDKKDIIWCSLKEGLASTQDTYLSPLRIELNYGYSQSISANYFIHKIAR